MKDSSFWTTAPGVLTAIAALITAIGGLLGVLYSAGVFTNDGGATASTPTATPEGSPSTVQRDLALVPNLSAHLWRSIGGGTSFLDVERYSYRAGVSHIEDLPPAGESIVLVSFNLGPVAASEIVTAELDLGPSDVVGDPFRDFGALVVEEVSIGDLSQVLAASPVRELARVAAPPSSAVNVTFAVRDALRRGATRFQVRLTFADVSLPNVDAELAASDSYAQWDSGPRLTVTIAQQ